MDKRPLKPASDEDTFQAESTLDLERQKPRPNDGKVIDGLGTLALGALAAGMLHWVSFYNGYPTVFSDTGGYLWTGAYHVAIPPFRAPGYSIFTNLTSLGRSAWLIVAAQSILVVYVLYETCDYLIGGSREYVARCFFAVLCVLAALTSLPWLVSLLMPDVFAGVFFLAAFLLAVSGELSVARRILLALVLMISVSAHLSLFPIGALFISALLLLRFVSHDTRELPSARSVLLWLLVPIISAGLWTATMNHKEGVGFRLSPSKNAFLLGRLFGNGLAADFLRENCPQRPLISCQYLSDLPRNEVEFLFQHPLVHDLEGHEDEIGTIVRGTISAYPVRLAISSARQTLHQLGALRTGDEIRSYSAKEWNNYAILQVFSAEVQRFWSSRQYRDRLAPAANAVASVHTPVFWLSLAACLLFAWAGGFARMNRFLASAAIFLVINAAICGALAGVYDRYQGRVAWIIPFCLCGYFSCWAREWKFKGVREQAITSWAHRETQSHRPHPVQTATPGDSENIPAEG